MKNSNITLIILLFVSFSFIAFGNNDTKTYKGTVTLESGEVLEGHIQLLSPTLNEIRVKFIDGNGNINTYKSNEITKYNFVFPRWDVSTKTYRDVVIEYVKKEVTVAPIPFGPKEVLIELQVKGDIQVYNYYMETRTSPHAFSHNYLIEKDGELILVDALNYKSVLKGMMVDFPELESKIGNKGYTYKYLVEVVGQYNKAMANKREGLIGMR